MNRPVSLDPAARLAQGLARLSLPQRDAVLHGEGPLLVLSGAGSGKTRTLTYRAAHLIERGVDPGAIMIVTFTNRAAREFRDRLEGLLGEQAAQRLWMSTLHSAGARILREHGQCGGFDPKFTILDQGDCLKVVRRIVKDLNWEKERAPIHPLANAIADHKEQLISPDQLRWMLEQDEFAGAWERDVCQVFEAYEERLAEVNAMDFADLIGHPIELLTRAPKVRDRMGIRYVLVDEYQDVNEAQHRMINLLLSEERNLTAVGDIDQAIYRFRGADYKLMLGFKRHYPGARAVSLGQNYRSTRTIVAAAARVIEKNQKRIKHKIWSEAGEGDPIVIIPVGDPEHEARHLAGQLAHLKGVVPGLRWRDCAVLYRTNYQSAEIEQALLAQQIPHYVFGAKFFARAEVKAVVRFLRFIDNPHDGLALSDIYNQPPRWISEATWEKLELQAKAAGISCYEVLAQPQALAVTPKARGALVDFYALLTRLRAAADQGVSLTGLVEMILEQTGLRKWYHEKDTAGDRKQGTAAEENLLKLVSLASQSYPGPARESLPGFLEYASLMAGEESAEADKDSVQMMTVHACKGLEWRVVFVVGAENGLMPHYRAAQDNDPDEALEEERRLFYVALTRAKELLYLYHARFRASPGGQLQRSQASPFLGEIPAEYRTVWKVI